MRTLAERASVQPATLVRLAQQLGYAGWPANSRPPSLRDLGLSGDNYAESGASAVRDARGRPISPASCSPSTNATSTTRWRNPPSLLKDAAKLLQKARTVHVAGFRASFPMVYALYYGYRLFRTSVHLVDGRSDDLAMHLRAIEKARTPSSSRASRPIRASRS